MNDADSFDFGKKTILSSSAIARLDKIFGVAAGLALLFLMIVVTIDVFGRYVFAAPLHGGFEYIRILMALLVFLALPVVVAREENVEVEAFHVLIPAPLRNAARILGYLVSIGAVLALTYVCYLRASSFLASGERFMILPAQLYPIAYFICAMWAICFVIMVFQFSGFLRSKHVAGKPE